jgi:prevent-host-death family protein
MPRVPIDEARDHLDELIQAAMGGDEVILTKDSRPVVKMVGIPQVKAKPRFGSARGKIEMADDFDAAPEDFRDYLR